MQMETEPYKILTLRNKDYVLPDTQEKIKNTTLLVAGCGIGSSFAETAVRIGFQNFILADGDVVDDHNLNRQCYVHADIGTPKVDALARRLEAINPNVKVRKVNEYLGPDNIPGIVSDSDMIFDTIDFLDLKGIVGLHDECRNQGKHALTAIAIGWGAGVVHFDPKADTTFRDCFAIPDEFENARYAETFQVVIDRLAERLDPDVVKVVAKALTVMEDGTPCPASQVSPGAASVGALGVTAAVRILAGLPVVGAPYLMNADMPTALTGNGIDMVISH